MNKPRIIQKGKIIGESFNIRITEPNGNVYYYCFLKSANDNDVMFSIEPLDIKGGTEISWDELPIKVKEIHYENIYPKDDLDPEEKARFLYGKVSTEDERYVFERTKASSFTISRFLAMEIYDKIGFYQEVNSVKENGIYYELVIDNKYIVKAKAYTIISIETIEQNAAKKKEWGNRINRIAKSAGTNFNFATVVANIEETDKAVEVLKEIKKALNSNDFPVNIKKNIPKWAIPNRTRIEYETKMYLLNTIPKSFTGKFNWSKRFFDEVEKILNNK